MSNSVWIPPTPYIVCSICGPFKIKSETCAHRANGNILIDFSLSPLTVSFHETVSDITVCVLVPGVECGIRRPGLFSAIISLRDSILFLIRPTLTFSLALPLSSFLSLTGSFNSLKTLRHLLGLLTNPQANYSPIYESKPIPVWDGNGTSDRTALIVWSF